MGLTPERGLYAVGDSWRKFVRPLVYRLIGDAYSLGGGGDGSPEEFDGFLFAHAPLNHSSLLTATMVTRHQAASRYRLTMVEDMKELRTPYAERLALSMSQPQNGMGVVELAEALGITRQAIDKVLKGGSKEMMASNNARAAQLLNVDPTWLATGEGTAQPAEFIVRWHERRLIELFRRLPAEEQDEFASLVESRCAIHEQHEESSRKFPTPITDAISGRSPARLNRIRK